MLEEVGNAATGNYRFKPASSPPPATDPRGLHNCSHSADYLETKRNGSFAGNMCPYAMHRPVCHLFI